MSKEYVSFIVMILATLLPKLGIVIANDDLTTFLSVALTLVAGIVGAASRYQKGDITVFGNKR